MARDGLLAAKARRDDADLELAAVGREGAAVARALADVVRAVVSWMAQESTPSTRLRMIRSTRHAVAAAPASAAQSPRLSAGRVGAVPQGGVAPGKLSTPEGLSSMRGSFGRSISSLQRSASEGSAMQSPRTHVSVRQAMIGSYLGVCEGWLRAGYGRD